jgi:hypothetical protein
MTDEADERGRLWTKIIITLLLITGIGIGLAIKKDCELPTKLQDNILSAFNSSIIIKEQSYGSIVFNLKEEPEIITQTDIIVENIIQCESQNQMVWGDLDLPIHAFGVAQFQERTFNHLKELANTPNLDFYKETDQIWLLKWAIENGYGNYWTCYRLLYN